jgi:hypothetical protein
LAASISLALLIIEVKRNQKRNTAALQYADAAAQKVLILAKNEASAAAEAAYKNACEQFEKRVSDLEKGIAPDYNEALAAKQAVDDFNMGISAILNFDPMAAVKKSREEQEAR